MPLLESRFPGGRFQFVGLGGGNGNFANRVLDCFPHAEGTVLDYSDMLLARNRPRSNKQRRRLDIVKLSSPGKTYDVVFCNWVLHHMLTGGFLPTRSLQRSVLAQARQVLAPKGILGVHRRWSAPHWDWKHGREIGRRAIAPYRGHRQVESRTLDECSAAARTSPIAGRLTSFWSTCVSVTGGETTESAR